MKSPKNFSSLPNSIFLQHFPLPGILTTAANRYFSLETANHSPSYCRDRCGKDTV